MRGLVWFREDLRTEDNTALSAAARKCTDGLIALYIIDSEAWIKHHMAPARIQFILKGLTCLREDLENLHIPLQVIKTKDVAAKILETMQTHRCQALFYNRQYEIDEIKRDNLISQKMLQHHLQHHAFDDQTILPPNKIRTQQGGFFKVFTPFKKAWQQIFLQIDIRLAKPVKPQKKLNIQSTDIPSLRSFKTTIDFSHWPSGPKAAQYRLKHFIKQGLADYHKFRDFPAKKGTSRLSPYLSCGMISSRQCFMTACAANHYELDSHSKGAITWMNELIWREFYKNLLIAVPRLSMHRAFKSKTEELQWRYNEKQFLAWQEGMTGIPIIDAAMRQLKHIGWMHNRLRMIVGMFFTKNMFFDWRLGEKYFIEHLIDGDLAANNGGWQWCASTGTDAAPYFRVFNPLSQSERFDPEGEFIRSYCPELKSFDNKAIHDPHTRNPVLAQKVKYPQPIVDLKLSRIEAIAAFKTLAHNNS